MSNNLENERSVSTNKMYPIDLAPQKITIVKSVSNADVKMAHLVPGQPKSTGASQIITHTGPLSLMRPSAQIISSSVATQVTQMVTQGSQIISQGPQIISQSQLIGASAQIVSPGTQIISQGTQLSAPVGNVGGNIGSAGQSGVSSNNQVLNFSGQLVSGIGGVVVSSSVRSLPSVRVLPPVAHHNTRTTLSSVNISTTVSGVGGGMIVSKAMTSHVPRGLAAGASLAVPRVAARPVTPASQPVSISTIGGSWSSNARSVRGAVVYSARAPRGPQPVVTPRAAIMTSPPSVTLTPVTTPAPAHSPLPPVITVPSTAVLTSNSVITGTVRGQAPRALAPGPTVTGPRPLPLLQRNYQPAKVVGVSSIGARGIVGNSAPAQLYYEVPRASPTPRLPRPITPHGAQIVTHAQPAQLLQTGTQTGVQAHQHHAIGSQTVNVVNVVRANPEERMAVATSIPTAATILPRPSILRKRDMDGSPTKTAGVGPPHVGYMSPRHDDQWEAETIMIPEQNILSIAEQNVRAMDQSLVAMVEGDGGDGSTTVSAASSPAPDEDMPSPPAPEPDISPRKKPRKQMMSNEVRRCDYQTEEVLPAAPTPPPVRPPPKRPQLSSSFVCGWRATALHFMRPADVKRRENRPRDILAIASQKHVLANADGWKVHHLTAQMDDLVSLESDVGDQLSRLLRSLETAHGKAQSALAPHSHTLLELLKGNIQRSRIVSEGVQEARADILRVFTHRTFVSDIIARQADKRCFRKHRLQS